VRYSSIIGGAPGVADCGNLEMHLEAVVAGNTISHHHCHSLWGGEAGVGILRYGENREGGMAYGDAGITQMF